MKSFVTWKILPLVLAFSFVLPAHRVQAGKPTFEPFAPFDAQLTDMDAALTQVLGEIEMVKTQFAAEKKVVKSLDKAKKSFVKAQEMIRAVTPPLMKAPTFPAIIKKLAGLFKKGFIGVDKAVGASGNNSSMLSYATAWGALLFLPLFAFMFAAQNISFAFSSTFSNSQTKKHIKMQQMLFASLSLMGMSSVFSVILFNWGTDMKQSIGYMFKAFKLALLFVTLIYLQQQLEAP